MDPHTVNLIMVINDLWHMEHAQDVKLFASAFFFIVCFATATFIFYDVIRGQKRKLAGTKMHSMVLSLAVAFYMGATFGFARTIDGIQDIAYMLAHPEAVTTLSQRSIILEIPLIGFALAILVFLIFYIKRYMKIPYSGDKKEN